MANLVSSVDIHFYLFFRFYIPTQAYHNLTRVCKPLWTPTPQWSEMPKSAQQ